MNTLTNKGWGLSGNQLKILALVTMTCDHVGKQLLPDLVFLQILGRLSFPIFAYMIAEGCLYTKNRAKYLLSMLSLAAACQLVYFFALGSLYQCVLVTFSLSIGLIYLLDHAVKRKSLGAWGLAVIGFLVVCGIIFGLPKLLPDTDFHIDFGLWGVLLPVCVWLGRSKASKLALMTADMLLLSLSMGGVQWYCFAAVAFLALYNGTRGKLRLKYLFYIYYPLHLAVIYLISLLLS